MFSELNTITAAAELSSICRAIGGFYRSLNEITTAKSYFLKSFEITERIANQTQSRYNMRSLAICASEIGDIYMTISDISYAKQYFEKSLSIFEKLNSDYSTVESEQDLALIYDKLGHISKELNNHREAREYYKAGLTIREKNEKKLGTHQSIDALGNSYFYLATVPESAQEQQYYLKEALRLYEMLSKVLPDIKNTVIVVHT